MGNKLVGRHGLHIYPFEPAEMILDPQSFFKDERQDLSSNIFFFHEGSLQGHGLPGICPGTDGLLASV